MARLGTHHHEHRTESLARVYFHCHPKGTGVICKAEKGLEADTFISEYLGYDKTRDGTVSSMIGRGPVFHGSTLVPLD